MCFFSPNVKLNLDYAVLNFDILQSTFRAVNFANIWMEILIISGVTQFKFPTRQTLQVQKKLNTAISII